VEELEKTLGAVTAQLKEQAAQIQNVSARLGMDKSAPALAVNNAK
jgi:hypothetical protein